MKWQPAQYFNNLFNFYFIPALLLQLLDLGFLLGGGLDLQAFRRGSMIP